MFPLRKAAAVLLTYVLVAAASCPVAAQSTARAAAGNISVAVGAQYDTTHVYVAPSDMDAYVNSLLATFGGHATTKSVANVLPVPSSTQFQAVFTPCGNFSVFAYETPVPFPFGQERTGYLVTDMDEAVKAAKGSGAEIVVAPFKDAIGRDAVVQWDGGVKTQLYWHTTAPSYDALEFVPENRVYVSPDRAGRFAEQFVRFSGGKVVSDQKKADAAEVGVPGGTYRRIRIESKFGKLTVLVTDGHLPFPFGRETTGYEVKEVSSTIAKAKAAGVTLLWGPFDAADRTSAVLEFPGGSIAEIHALKK
jgi:hypothetical protein